MRLTLLQENQVGDGEGMMIPSGTRNPAGALLFADYLMSGAVQIGKLAAIGSRTARLDLDLGALSEDVAVRLVPLALVAERSRKRIVASVSSEATARFVAEILHGQESPANASVPSRVAGSGLLP